MLIHIDFSKLEDHLRILDQELTQGRRNAELLNQLRSDPTICSYSDLELIDKEIRFMELQIRNTRSRKDFLEEMAVLLRSANNQMSETIFSAEAALQQLG